MRLGAWLALAVVGVAMAGAASPELPWETRVDHRLALDAIARTHRGSRIPTDHDPRARAEHTVRDDLRLFEALERHWAVRIDDDTLRREWNRIVLQTRDPRRLAEMVAGLDDDPVAVLESLVRPVLSRRIARNRFAYDERIHAAAGRDLERLRLDVLSGALAPELDHPWRSVRSLRAEAARSGPAAGEVGPIREAREWFAFEAAFATADGSTRIATYRLPKVTWDEWWATTRLGFDGDGVGTVATPTPLGVGAAELAARDGVPCSAGPDDLWAAIADGVLDERSAHSVVWTGSELIVWGGEPYPTGGQLGTGARYDPALDAWSGVSTAGAPSPRAFHSAVWTGSEMIVWGGRQDGNPLAGRTGARYDPVTDTWSAVPDAPIGRSEHTAIWTGSEMIVWGGHGGDSTGARLDPGESAWTLTSTVAAPLPRVDHTAVWTGDTMIVWGGRDPATNDPFGDGAAYDPASDTWQRTPSVGAPAPRYHHASVWTGTEMLVWGGHDSSVGTTGGRFDPSAWQWLGASTSGAPASTSGTAVWTGSEMLIDDGPGRGRYDPVLDAWTPMAAPPISLAGPAVWTGAEMIRWSGARGARYDAADDDWIVIASAAPLQPRQEHTAIWTGAEMIVWGGRLSDLALGDGAAYDPSVDAWTPLAASGAPAARSGHTAVWTGDEMLVWGGRGAIDAEASGGRYDPAADTWSPTTLVDAPAARTGHVAVWTGDRMLVWGGPFGAVAGGRYDPTADTWSAIGLDGAPESRLDATAVWTGAEMVVWGGRQIGVWFDTGGRYDPVSDTWTATASTDAPSARSGHTAVWTDDRMLVWGGRAGGPDLDPAEVGTYDPAMDEWTLVTSVDPPQAREDHSAVWTGAEMFVFGGAGLTPEGTGGRYDPTSATWRPTSAAGAPSGRYGHTAVWTGDAMLVWGGRALVGDVATGAGYAAALDPDADGVVDACDCAPDDGTAFAEPGEVQALAWNAAGTSLTWAVVDAGTGTVYDVLRGRTGEWPVGTGASEVCLESGTAVPPADEADDPLPGEAAYYLVRARNACSVGGYGTATDGAPRASPTCP